jgi:MFS transporter, putative metabolite transport protein
MAARTTSVEDAPLSGFHWKIAIYTAGGPFCDGYILSIIGVALAVLGPQFGFGSLMTGLIGAAALVGIFFGGLFFG